jgi:RNA polymerase sigma-70 factor (ECF subfamily)
MHGDGQHGMGREAQDFERFYAAHARAVEAYLAPRTGSREAAKDLAADTFATALARRGQFRGSSPPEERAWILAIARSQLSHHWRRASIERRAVATFEIEGGFADEPTVHVEQRCDIERARPHLLAALSALPAVQRRTVALRVVHDLEYDEIAEQTGVSEQVARARVSRGLRALAGRLGRGHDQGAAAAAG